MGEVVQMFNQISKRYDLINRVLSLGMDVGWRHQLARATAATGAKHVLDVATGTGDVAIALARAGISRVVGVDPAQKMLAIGREKLVRAGVADHVELVLGSAESFPFPDGAFDAATISFGIRNAANLDQAVSELCRVLKPGGTLFVLEFSTPGHPIIRLGWRAHLRLYVPLVGGLLSGDFNAYRYLNRTIEAFPSGEAFLGHLSAAGFTQTKTTPLCLGAVSIYEGRRPVNT